MVVYGVYVTVLQNWLGWCIYAATVRVCILITCAWHMCICYGLSRAKSLVAKPLPSRYYRRIYSCVEDVFVSFWFLCRWTQAIATLGPLTIHSLPCTYLLFFCVGSLNSWRQPSYSAVQWRMCETDKWQVVNIHQLAKSTETQTDLLVADHL